MQHVKDNKRKDPRHDFASTIEYREESSPDDMVQTAVTVNISTAGIGAYLFSPQAEGQNIIIRTPLPVDGRRATIRWIKQEDENFFLTGLQFVDHPEP